MMQVRQLTESARHHASVDDCTRHGVEVVEGEARLSSPWTVKVEGRTLTTRAVVIATGSRPWLPPIPGLDAVEP